MRNKGLCGLPFSMSDTMKEDLVNRLNNITAFNQNYKTLEYLKYINNTIDSIEHIVIGSKFLNIDDIDDIYDLVFPKFDTSGKRAMVYCKFRKKNKFSRCEGLYTLASYLQACGITDRLEILNRILLILGQ